MDTIRFVERDNVKFYCFIEASVVLFPDTPKSTVRGWLRLLGIPCVNSTAEERRYFRTENPFLSGSFGLIAHDDLTRLVNFKEGKAPSKRWRANSSSCTLTSKQISTNNSSTSAVPGSLGSLASYGESSDEDEVCVQDIPCVMPDSQTKSHAIHDCLPATSTDCKENEDLPTVSSAHIDRTLPKANKMCKDRSNYQLSCAEAPEKLKSELTFIRQFYIKPINPRREATNFSESTTQKMEERIMCFMFYCKTQKNIEELSLSLFNDDSLVSDYVDYLRTVRKLMPSTITSILTVAINVVKYNLRDSLTNADDSREIVIYRRFQRQFAKETRIVAKRSKEGLTKKSTQQFYFAHVLECMRNLRTNYLESSGVKKARYLHDFVLLATYLRVMPGRSQEIRTLQLFLESEEKPFNYWDWEKGNVLVFHLDKRVVLLECDYKTSKSAGPTKIDITDDSELISFLQKYLSLRPTLMQGKVHNSLFLNYHGDSFCDSSAIAKYLGDLFQREVAIRASTTALRHAIVSYFSSIDESKDVNVRESLAKLMKHSVRYQQSVYNDMTHDEKTKKGRNLLRDKIASDVFGSNDELVERMDEDSSDEGESSSEEFELRPKVGDICGLLDGESTPDNIEFFLAKVARYTDDRKEAHLMHLEHAEGSENLYRLKPGRVWTESTKALVFPLDIVYNSSERAYELRTTAEEIYNCVHNKN